MLIKPSTQVTDFFQVESSGVLSNGSSPEVLVYRNGTLTAIIPTVTNVSTGIYKYVFDVPNNWLNYDQVTVVLSLVVSGFTTVLTKKLGTVLDISKVEEVWQLLALDSANPVIHTPNSITSGDISITLDVDQQNSSVTSQRV